jgi:hypothetical protein
MASSRGVGRNRGRTARAGVAAIATAALAAVAAAPGSALPATAATTTPQPISVARPEMPPPLAAGPAPDLDLIFSAQVAGWVEPCG